MAKSVADSVLDGALDILKNNVTRQVACSAEPTTYAEANATYALADVTLASGDFTNANGDTSGRKNTIQAQSAVPIDTSGTATHVAVCLTASSSLRLITTCTSQALTSGGTVDIGSFKHELATPT